MIEFVNAIAPVIGKDSSGPRRCFAWMSDFTRNGDAAQVELSEDDLVKLIAEANDALGWVREGKF